MDNELIGISQNMRRIRELIDRIAQTGLNTIICGETGVGKELVVQSLYQKSDRVGKPFVKVNCAALPDSLLESEMFGYEQGAFTGAERRRRGKFEQAHGGVLFLDEIGDMTLPLQSKLLHVLQGGDFTPLGSEKSVKTNAWVIAATNHELEKDLTAGKFREDLYFRLSAIKIFIEPLRNRQEDIPYLIDYYIQKYKREFNTRDLVMPRQKTIDRLCTYTWPGNVRELQNMLKRVMILGDGEENISALIHPGAESSPPEEISPPGVTAVSAPQVFDPKEIGDLSALSLKKMRKKAMDQVEREVISYVLQKTAWNRSKATKILKISYKTLLYKIKDLGIQPPPDALE
ncbi:MAG: sigma-54 dependent transcriptional regulator [Desulfobacterales bacterium]|jgi:transcriptional regulator with PAS, ATPase and Fis domain|nr:sigma-54 dependent transcriptional regulator [Desulfobacterales bacterium]